MCVLRDVVRATLTINQRKERGIEECINVPLVSHGDMRAWRKFGDAVSVEMFDRSNGPGPLKFYACRSVAGRWSLGTVHKV